MNKSMSDIFEKIKGYPRNLSRIKDSEEYLAFSKNIRNYFSNTRSMGVHMIDDGIYGSSFSLPAFIQNDRPMIIFANNFYSEENPAILLLAYTKDKVYRHKFIANFLTDETAAFKLEMIIDDAKNFMTGRMDYRKFIAINKDLGAKEIFANPGDYKIFYPEEKISILGKKVCKSTWERIFELRGKIKRGIEPTISEVLEINPEDPTTYNQDFYGQKFGLAFLDKNKASIKTFHTIRNKLFEAGYSAKDGPFLYYGTHNYHIDKIKEAMNCSQETARVMVDWAKKKGLIKILD